MSLFVTLILFVIAIGLYIAYINRLPKPQTLQKLLLSIAISVLFSYPFKVLLAVLGMSHSLPVVSGIHGCIVMTVLLLSQGKDLPSILSYVLSFTFIFIFGWFLIAVFPALYNLILLSGALHIAGLPIQSGFSLWDNNKPIVLNMDSSTDKNRAVDPINSDKSINETRALELEKQDIQMKYNGAYVNGRSMENHVLSKEYEFYDRVQRFWAQHHNEIKSDTNNLILQVSQSNATQSQYIELNEARRNHLYSKARINNQTYGHILDILCRDGGLSQTAMAEVSSMKSDLAYIVNAWEKSYQKREEYEGYESMLEITMKKLEQSQKGKDGPL